MNESTLLSNELERLTWGEVEEYLRHDRRLALVLGSTEQHGRLSIGNDTLIPQEIARRATRAEGVLLAPPLHFGRASMLGAWPGTLWVSAGTYARFVVELARSAYQSGFTKLFFVNGHLGNSYVVHFLQELREDSPGLECEFYDWGIEPEIVQLASEISEGGITHANWGENWPIARPARYEEPAEEADWWKYDRNINLYTAAEIRENAPGGSFGGPISVPDDDLQRLIELAVRLAIEKLRKLGA